jgi:hypothetical protein
MKMNGTLLLSCALVAVLLAGGPARADSLETISLHHRMAEDLIPILQPMLPQGAVVSGAGDVLLVRADDATLAQVRDAVMNLDRAPRQLLIVVGQGTGQEFRDAGVAAAGTVVAGDARIGVNQPPQATSGGQVIVHGGTTQSDIEAVSSVRALEGYESYVAVGETRAFATTSGTGAYSGRETGTGFYATPRLNGDRVTLEISPTQRHAAAGSRGSVSTQSVTTTVAGKLGEWIPIGGATSTETGSSAGILIAGQRTELTRYSAWVKVEEVH